MAEFVPTAESVYSSDRKTLSAVMRQRRFVHINAIIRKIIDRTGRCRILDIGGSEYYWQLNRATIDAYRGLLTVTISNIGDDSNKASGDAMFDHIVGDATRDEAFAGDYDFIHSNSVIEHVGPWTKIRAMADAILRTGKPYYVQTPNFWFPIEPHFRSVGFQWLPQHVRSQMLVRKPRGFRTAKSYDEAMENVQSVHLLTINEMKLLFPDSEIRREYFGPFVKSIMAVKEPQ